MAANVAAVEAKTAHIDPDLETIVNAWPDLPDEVKADILAMVKEAAKAE